MSAYDLVWVALRLACGGWLLWRVAGPAPRLDDDRGARPSCRVVVPARNEEANLPGCLAALVPQLRPGDELVVVDDGSTDGTGAVARAAGATVVSAASLPAGWTGKNWACATGARNAPQPVLCFVDADTRVAPGSLDALVADRVEVAGMVSAQPYHLVPTVAEKASAFFNVVALMGTDGHTPLGARRTPNGAYGPVLVVATDDYRELGGHEAVADQVLDDVELARVWQRAGRPVRLYAGREVATYRMYPGGLGALLQGWTKNFAAGAGGTRLTTLALVVAWLSLPIQAAWWVASATLAATVDIGAGGPSLAVAGALYAVTALQLWWLLRRAGSFGAVTALVFPLPLLVFLAVFVRSAVVAVARRPVRWKGRQVPPARR